MKPVPMKFGEYVWHNNQQNISIECEKSVAEMKRPFGEASVQYIAAFRHRVFFLPDNITP